MGFSLFIVNCYLEIKLHNNKKCVSRRAGPTAWGKKSVNAKALTLQLFGEVNFAIIANQERYGQFLAVFRLSIHILTYIKL